MSLCMEALQEVHLVQCLNGALLGTCTASTSGVEQPTPATMFSAMQGASNIRQGKRDGLHDGIID